jgi:hypothetical protein
LLNNFIIIKNGQKNSNLIKGNNFTKNNDIINTNNNKTNTPKIKSDYANIININKNDESTKNNNSVRERQIKNSAKILNKKNNIFRLGIKINDNNNLMQINNFNPQYIYNNNYPRSELDYKTKENLLMPMIFPPSLNNTIKNKNKNSQIQYNILKDNNEKTKNYLPKNKHQKNSIINNIKSIQPMSQKEIFDDKISSVKQLKYTNMNDKIQDIKVKSSSLKILDNKRNDLKLKINTIINSSENSMRNYKYKLKKYNINNLNIKEQLKITKQKMNDLLNKDFDINNNNNNLNKLNDIFLQSIRSKSTGNFVKLKSAHAITGKNSTNKYNSNNLKWFINEDKKIFNNNNKDSNLMEVLSINGITSKKIK